MRPLHVIVLYGNIVVAIDNSTLGFQLFIQFDNCRKKKWEKNIIHINVDER